MLKNFFLFFILGFLVLESCKEESKTQIPESTISIKTVKDAILSNGQLKRVDSFPSKYIKSRNVDVWLPDGYSESKKYAVLYMHDGQNLFDATKTWNKQEWRVDEIVADLTKKDSIKEIIVVGIWNVPEIRYQDYFPEKAYDLLAQKDKDSLEKVANEKKSTISLNADAYLKFMVKELKPFVDGHFSTLPDSLNTFVAGSSMGGLISMYAVCEYPDVFGGAACISTHWPGVMPAAYNPIPKAIFEYMALTLPGPESHKFYFDYGTETLDKYYPQYLDEVDRIFINKKYNIKNYMNLEFEGADHSEDSWNRRFDIPLTFLLKKQK